MKYIAAVLASILLLASCQAVLGSLGCPPRTLQRRASPGLLQASALSGLDCGGTTSSCADCTTTLSCVRLGDTYRAVSTAACPTATPYCMAGQCVATMANESCNQPPAPTNSFICNGEGYFPDPASCTRYYLCVNGNAYQYDCSGYSGTVYSHARAMCVPRAEVGSCPVTSCSTALVGKYQQYAVDPTVYFVCTDTSASNALVAACPANRTIDTTSTTGECRLTCTDEGRLPDSSNSQHYYECIKLGTNRFTEPLPFSCPDGSTYNQQDQRCISGSSNPTPDSGTSDLENYFAPDSSVPESVYRIPDKVLIGSATSSYQIEGAWNLDGKGVSIWDVYTHSRPTMDNGDVACDSYHKYREDVALLKELGMQSYRFSLSWTRLLPTGGSDNVNAAGVEYYHNLINELKANGIEPLVTIHHWDLPQVYQDDGGWLNSKIQDRFLDFATFAFREFGDGIKYWVVLNEPHIFCSFGYEGTNFAPGVGQTGTGGYSCVHNMILAHAKAYHVYDTQFRSQYGGLVGSSMDMTYSQPLTNSEEDKAAAERSMVWTFAWIADPLTFGDYPAIMRQTVDANSQAAGTASRLPAFTADEKAMIRGTLDFIGLNHYTSSLATTGTGTRSSVASISNDTNVASSRRSTWVSGASGPICPWGLRAILNWIHKRYNGPPIMVTENGYGDFAENDSLNDDYRVAYYSGYMRAAMRAANEDGVNLIGYTAWSLMDNLEWSAGYSRKYGITYVDFNDDNRPRTIKKSGRFVSQAIASKHVPYVAIPSQ